MNKYGAVSMPRVNHDLKNKFASPAFLGPLRRRLTVVATMVLALLAATSKALAQGNNPPPAPSDVCKKGQDLIAIPEIKSQNGFLKAELLLTEEKRTLWGSAGDNRCLPQPLRVFEGRNLMPAGPIDPRFSLPAPLPGPTFRARVGDLVEITFLNQVNPADFAATLDLAEQGKTTGCDTYKGQPTGIADWTGNTSFTQGSPIQPTQGNPGNFYFTASQAGTTGSTQPAFPQTVGATVSDNSVVWTNAGRSIQIYPGAGGDTMPNCLHGSVTSNLHFHGTHTTPDTTGDNVLLYIRPALRQRGEIRPPNAFVSAQFAEIFNNCEKNGPPTKWDQIPATWQKSQKDLIQLYDTTLPPNLPKLWPQNEKEIAQGLWPQYQIGAYPYCFRLPEQGQKYKPQEIPTNMGQAPGTHWYHAHKHGSTALNVANGMTGAFIIAGKYDDDLRKFYSKGLNEQVLMIQQVSSTPFPLITTNPAPKGPGSSPRPPLSVNGRLEPVVHMRPGEVQQWRIVNGSFRDAVEFAYFTGPTGSQPCNQPGPETIVVPCIHWRQIAQDGVQFNFTNYQRVGKQDNSFNLAPANRADLLVKAPTQKGQYALVVQPNEGLLLQGKIPPRDKKITLLTVLVDGDPLNPPMDFIQQESDFPTFPDFLADIPASSVFNKRRVIFGAGNTNIDGKAFNPNRINQAMLLNSAEEWTVMNQATDKSHPFHIHVNPFQITELFQPNDPDTLKPQIPDKQDPSKLIPNPCYVDPQNPKTWKPCKKLSPPFVWWDTFAIPTGRTATLTICTVLSQCPEPLRQWTKCSTGANPSCTVTIPGYFKMRSRFVDYTGQYVLHCHILIHEDRGMMQLIEVVPDTTLYTHH